MHIAKVMSPNWNERPSGCEVDLVVLHYTGMRTAADALARLCDPDAEVSAHYMIDEDGSVVQMVPEEKRAWHAGVSHWRGRDNINHTSIGIELVNPGHEFGYRSFPDVQIDSLLELLDGIRSRWEIPMENYVGHSDVAPDRKSDPGELFPWQRLASEGFGIYAHIDGCDTTPVSLKDTGNLNKQLALMGYHMDESSGQPDAQKKVLRAFQAHWRPAVVTGRYDKGTGAVLNELATHMSLLGERA